MSPVVIIAIVIVVLLAVVIVIMLNSLIGRKNQVENAFAGIDVQLKKRYDLIPNLVSAVQKYMEHEKSTLTELTELRAKASRPDIGTDEKIQLDNRMRRSIRNIMLVAENYPDLKASENMTQLQRSLNEVEEQLSASRRAYNAAVTDFNNAVEMFPSCLIAVMMGYKMRTLFEIPEEQRENVNVKELFNS